MLYFDMMSFSTWTYFCSVKKCEIDSFLLDNKASYTSIRRDCKTFFLLLTTSVL